MEKVIESKVCKNCEAAFTITDADLAFYDQMSPTFDGQKFAVPSPKLCFDCRFQKRLAFRNERNLYTRKCDLTGTSIITNFAPNTTYKVFSKDAWWSDKWSGFDYGRDFDFNRTFTEQFNELVRVVPHQALTTTNCENSDYANFFLNSRNSYLIFGGANDEDCYYGKYIVSSKDCVDNLALYSSELCYETVACETCYNCKFAINSRNSTDCLMIDNCQSCKNCIGCFGLISKEYYIFNEFVGKEKYEEMAKEYEYLTVEKISFLRKKLNEISAELPHRGTRIFGSENCTGDNIYNSTNCQYSFDAKECEDSKYLNFSPKNRNCYDITFSAPGPNEFCYNIASSIGTQVMNAYLIWYCDNTYYSLNCHNSSNLFGCVGLKNQKFCIFNKQYTKEEYEKTVAKIIACMQKTGEWGEFLDYSSSTFGYNETVAQEYFPLEKSGAAKLNTHWCEKIRDTLEGAPQKNLPNDIREVTDDINSKVLTCEISGRPYKIIPQELAFYRKMKLPIPRLHPDTRHMNRIKQHNPYHLFSRICSKCSSKMQTTYPPNTAKVLYCEKCYLETVY